MTIPSKIHESAESAVLNIADGDTLLIGGWGKAGIPDALVSAVVGLGIKNLTLVSNNCGEGRPGDVSELFRAGLVSKVITTFPTSPLAVDFRHRLERNEVELEVTPQGTLAERLRSAGAGLGGFYTPTAYGTLLGEGKEVKILQNRPQIFEESIYGDVALIYAEKADTVGNLQFRYAARNFSPLMAMAAKHTVIQVKELVEVGSLHPDSIHLPGIFVDRIFVKGDQNAA